MNWLPWQDYAARTYDEVGEFGSLTWLRTNDGVNVGCYADPCVGILHSTAEPLVEMQAVNDSNTSPAQRRGRWSMAFQWMPLEG